MKKTLTLLCCLFFTAFYSNAQIFWTENFESGSTSGMLAGSYTGPNGTWVTSSTGANGADHNAWFVSCAENGHTAGVCGTGCVATSSTATLATLHIGANSSFSGVDNGASYDAGGFCPALTCPKTNQRAESPTINCTGKSGITLSFNYIENGDGTNDDCTIWYYDGTSWALLTNPGKTPLCSGQGQWQKFTFSLPSSANGNANVKIGFNWTDNDDGVGTDPSFAVDSVSLSAPGATPVASFTTSPTPATICTDSCLILTSTSTVSSGSIDSVRWVGVIAGFPVLLGNTNPYSFCTVTPYNVPGTYTIRLRAYSGGNVDSSTSTVTVNRSPKPTITKAGKVLSVPSTGYTSYKWSNAGGPIAGATTSSYTYSVSGTYTVVVDSGGCKGSASMSVAGAGVYSLYGVNNTFWLSQQDNGTVILHSDELTSEPLTINMYDATGRQVINTVWERGTDIKEIKNLSLSPGVYIVRLSNQNTAIVLKMLRQ